MTDFGRDTSCTTDLRTGRFASGARLVAEACFRRLTTPRGMLRGGEEEANYGLDVADLVGRLTTEGSAAALPGQIRAELKKDERLDEVEVSVLATTVAAQVSYTITIEGTTGAGPFELVLRVSAVTVELLGIKAEG